MKCTSWAVFGTVAALACLPANVDAQRKLSRRGELATNFAQGPEVGKPLPDVTAFDADGKPFKLASLKGQHTVIVFGCLT